MTSSQELLHINIAITFSDFPFWSHPLYPFTLRSLFFIMLIIYWHLIVYFICLFLRFAFLGSRYRKNRWFVFFAALIIVPAHIYIAWHRKGTEFSLVRFRNEVHSSTRGFAKWLMHIVTVSVLFVITVVNYPWLIVCRRLMDRTSQASAF